MASSEDDRREQRWAHERAYFDGIAYADGPISSKVIERYAHCKKPWLPAEYPFAVLGDVAGKRVLEIGSGDGGNAILLALKGAHVVGMDISRRAVETAQKRAAMHGVGQRTSFLCTPLEQFEPTHRFDLVVGWAVLHHLIPVLEPVLLKVRSFGSEGARFVFVEPVNLAPWLRRIRLALPIRTDGTPDERPLEAAEIAIIKTVFNSVRVTPFDLTLRLGRFVLGGTNYEEAHALARRVYDSLARFDRFLVTGLGAATLAGTAVFQCSS